MYSNGEQQSEFNSSALPEYLLDNRMDIKTNTLLTARNVIISRLLTCFVNEGLVKSYIVEPPSGTKRKHGQLATIVLHWCQVLKLGRSSGNSIRSFWIPLKRAPLTVLLEDQVKVTLLDPQDISFPVLNYTSDTSGLTELTDPSELMNLLAEWNNLDSNIVKSINEELSSSVEHLDHAYRNGRNPPKLGDPGIAWEQSIVEGHPTHPMCKSRQAHSPIQHISPKTNLGAPSIHFFAVPRCKFIITGKYEELIQKLIEKQDFLDLDLDLKNETIIPVHEIQIPNIIQKFPFARNLGFSESALAQCSLRTVLISNTPEFNVKLPIGMIITSMLRTIDPRNAQLSPYFKFLTDTVVEDKENLITLNELGSIVSNDPNPDIAKHLSCIIREDPDAICSVRDEIVIVCAAFIQTEGNNDMYALTRAFQLDTSDKRLRFFKTYVKKYLKAFLVPLYKYGFVFEAHLQNTLARFKKDEDGNYGLVGFAVRDFGGIGLYEKQFKEMTGIDIKSGACRIQNDAENNRTGFHVMIQMHLHGIIRALDLHYSGVGWSILRGELDAMLPQNCITRKMWLESDAVDYKCFLTMKLLGINPKSQYCKIPNLIMYSPDKNNNQKFTPETN